MAPSAIQDITSGSERIPLSIYPVLLQEPWVNLYISLASRRFASKEMSGETPIKFVAIR